MRKARLVISFVLVLLLVPTFSPEAGAATQVIDRFEGDVTGATLDFSMSLGNSSLSIEIPPGAAIESAELTVAGVQGQAVESSTLNFTTGNVGKDLWAFYNEGRAIYPPKVVPGNHRWMPAINKEITRINTSDDTYWKTDTQDPQAGRPPGGAYPIQLYSFLPQYLGADNITVRWEGLGTCAFNKTNNYHAEMWLYNHTDRVWIMVEEYSNNNVNLTDEWLNYTFDIPSPFVAGNGSVDVAIVGTHSEWAGPMLPAYDEGHLWTDYIELDVSSKGGIQYPSDISLYVEDIEVAVLTGEIVDPITIGDAQDLAGNLQAALDTFKVTPDNVSLPLTFFVGGPTAGWLHVSGLRIEYEPVVNAVPTYEGPETVNIDEDGGWSVIMDLDAIFFDDFNMGELSFSSIGLVDPPFALPPYPVEFRTGYNAEGNVTLEVYPDPDFFILDPLEVAVTATDLFNSSTSASFDLLVDQKSDRPVLTAEPNLEAFERTRFTHTVGVTDADLPDDELSFSDDSELVDIDPATGEIDWTPGSDQIGAHTFQVTVTDRFGLTDRIQITITVQNSNDPPVISPEPEIDAKQGVVATYMIQAEDPDIPFGDVLRYSAFADAIQLSVDQVTGRMTFTPTNDHVPYFNVTIRVQDLLGRSDETVLHVNVENVNDAPVFLIDGTTWTHEQNQGILLDLAVEDPDLLIPVGETLTFTAVGPDAFKPDEDGTIALDPDQSLVGEHEVTYTVTDGGGLTDVIVITWVITDVNDKPLIDTDPPSSVNEDEPFELTMEATDADGDTITWTDDTDVFDIDPVTGTISFTPTQEDVGVHRISITADDGRGYTAVLTFDLEVVNVNDDPVIVVMSKPDGEPYVEGDAVEIAGTATDEDGDQLTYVWTMDGKELGRGPVLNTNDLPVGKSRIVLTVTDGNGGSATHEIEVEVQSSLGTSLLLPIAIVIIIVVVVAIALVARGRSSKEGPAQDGPPDGTVEETTAGSQEEVVEYDTDSVTVMEDTPGAETSMDLGEGPLVDVTEAAPEPEEAPIYNLEEAGEYRPQEGNGGEPEE